MNGREGRAVGAALGVLLGVAAAQAQDVHKCTVNGAVNYQSTPCPSGDVVLQAPPTPSEQESRQARSDLSRQRAQAAYGRIMRPAYAPPPPPPAPQSTTTTIIVLPNTMRHGVIVHQTQSASPPLPPPSNCDKLNHDNDEALERRDQLRAPSELASHAELLHKAEADAARIAQLATASNCRLKR